MKKFLNILSWSLLTFFLVPSGLILASWNAVPGDALYGIKVNLEKSLIKVTPSLALQSSLEVSYTERRLTETEQLLADAYKAQETIQSLNNLDAQVAQAQYAIENVSDPTQKAALTERYIDTLARIASKLEENKQNLAAAPDIQTPTTAERIQQPIAQVGTQQANTQQQSGSQVAQTQIQTQPATTEPSTTQSSTTQSNTTQTTIQPSVAQSNVAQSSVTQQSNTQPTTQPAVVQPTTTTQQTTVTQPAPTKLTQQQAATPQQQTQTIKPETKTVVAAPIASPPPTQHVTVASQIQVTQATVNTTMINMQRLKRQIEQQSQSQGVKRGEDNKDKKEPEKKPTDSIKTDGSKQEQNVEQKQTQHEQSNTEVKTDTPNANVKSDGQK